MVERVMRGSTPRHEFEVGEAEFDVAMVADLRISYAQDGEEVLVKALGDCELEGRVIACRLTQEETYKFDSEKKLFVQLKVKTQGGEVIVSEPITLIVGRSFNDEVL